MQVLLYRRVRWFRPVVLGGSALARMSEHPLAQPVSVGYSSDVLIVESATPAHPQYRLAAGVPVDSGRFGHRARISLVARPGRRAPHRIAEDWVERTHVVLFCAIALTAV